MIGRFMLIFIIVVAVLGIIGIWMLKRNKGGDSRNTSRSDTENVADLNDRFNRARYMDQDGN